MKLATLPFAVARIVSSAAANVAASRATIATSAPEADMQIAVARPSPLLPPVINATRPSRRISIVPFPLLRQTEDARRIFGRCDGAAMLFCNHRHFADEFDVLWFARAAKIFQPQANMSA